VPSSYTLGSHYESFVRALVESGRYASASEVMRDGLRLVEEREQLRQAKLSALQRDIAEGLASGPGEPLDMEGLKAEARRRRKADGSTSGRGA
jgi:antitoxin ParD1/3/4